MSMCCCDLLVFFLVYFRLDMERRGIYTLVDETRRIYGGFVM